MDDLPSEENPVLALQCSKYEQNEVKIMMGVRVLFHSLYRLCWGLLGNITTM